MPIVLALLRYLVIAIIQLGAASAASAALQNLSNWVRGQLKTTAGMTEQEIDDWWGNKVIDAVAFIGVQVALMKSKIPLKLADSLGLKAGKIAKVVVTPEVEAKATKAVFSLEQIGKSAVVKILAAVVGIPASIVWLVNAVANTIEPGVYKPEQTNAVYKSLGIPFQYPTEAQIATLPPLFTAGTFNDWATALELAGAFGINNVIEGTKVVYTRDNLAAFATESYSKHTLAGEKESADKIIKRLTPYVYVRKGAGVATPTLEAGVALSEAPASSPAANTQASAPQATAPSTKVFVGTVGQGTLTSATDFTPRPDDLIQSMDELETALRNNLAPFLASALGRFVYETKVVSSVTTKDGFTQRGTAQKVVSGYNKNGSPKYKTVVNKFAVATVYFLSESGTRTKAGQIVLGPTDAVKFQPNAADLGNLDLSVRDDIHTSSLADVSEVKKGNTTTALPVAEDQPLAAASFAKASNAALARLFRAGAGNGNPPPDQLYADTGKRIYEIPGLQAVGAGIWDTQEEFERAHNAGTHYDITRQRLKDRYGIDFDSLPARNPADLYVQALNAGYDYQTQYDPGRGNVQNPIYTVGSVPELITLASGADTTRPIGAGPACAAENLSDFFAARGEQLPSVEVRSVLYEQYGIGTRGFYTGTSEQNAKLLAKLKAQAGCPI